jgi:hypothetical protein
MWKPTVFLHLAGADPLGHSSTNLSSLYKGFVRDTFQNFKHLREAAHAHDPLDAKPPRDEARNLRYTARDAGDRHNR